MHHEQEPTTLTAAHYQSLTTSTQCKDTSRMSSHEAKGHRKHLDDIIHGNMRPVPGIGGEPEKDCVDGSNGKLEGGDEHGESVVWHDVLLVS